MADHAIVVGIDTYPGIGALQGPCKDATTFYNWLVNPAEGGIDPANVERVLSEDFPKPNNIEEARPTSDDVLNLFRPFIRQVGRDEHENGRLFIFMAGHGLADTQRDNGAALYVANAENNVPLHLAVSRCADWLRRNWAFDEIILIMDCCRSTNAIHEVKDPQLPRTNGNVNANKVKMFHGFATGWGQESREKSFYGTVRGIFTVALMDALKHATPNRHGRVTGNIIEDYIHNKIYDLAGDTEISSPDIDSPKRKNVCFLTRQSNTVDVSFATSPEKIGSDLVIFSHDLREIDRLTIEGAEFTVPIAPGQFYACSIVGENNLLTFQVPSDDAIEI